MNLGLRWSQICRLLRYYLQRCTSNRENILDTFNGIPGVEESEILLAFNNVSNIEVSEMLPAKRYLRSENIQDAFYEYPRCAGI
jgi:hypothetical protein